MLNKKQKPILTFLFLFPFFQIYTRAWIWQSLTCNISLGIPSIITVPICLSSSILNHISFASISLGLLPTARDYNFIGAGGTGMKVDHVLTGVVFHGIRDTLENPAKNH